MGGSTGQSFDLLTIRKMGVMSGSMIYQVLCADLTELDAFDLSLSSNAVRYMTPHGRGARESLHLSSLTGP